MPPKESAKEKKERERAQALAQQLFQQRQDMEIDEERGRQQRELEERLGRAELAVESYQAVLRPPARMVVWKTDYDALVQRTMTATGELTKELLQLQTEREAGTTAAQTLRQELVFVRNELRTIASLPAQPNCDAGPRAAMLQADHVTDLLVASQPMHTRIPPRIRRVLSGMDQDTILVLFDTLSFDDAVLQYLLFKFPPGPDVPPHTRM